MRHRKNETHDHYRMRKAFAYGDRTDYWNMRNWTTQDRTWRRLMLLAWTGIEGGFMPVDAFERPYR